MACRVPLSRLVPPGCAVVLLLVVSACRGGAVDRLASSQSSLDGAVCNLAVWSEAIDDAAWTKASVTVTANAAASPLTGQNTAEAVFETADVDWHFVGQIPFTPDGAAHTLSFYAKPGLRSWLWADLGSDFGCYVDLAAMTFGYCTGGQLPANPSVTDAGNGWRRVSFARATPAGSSGWAYIGAATGNGAGPYAGNSSGPALFVWGVQVESGNTVHAYVPTTSTSACSGATTNLALNKPATAASLESAGYVASNVVDGNTATRWASAMGLDPQWIYVDLQGTYAVSRVKLTWEVAYAQAYQVQVSNDAATWITIYSTTASDGGIDDLTGLGGVGRFVRVLGTARATPWGYSLWELEVYGTSADFQGTDVGSVGATGSIASSAGTSTVAGAGADIWGTTDGFFFANTQVTGDLAIVARLQSLTNTHTYAKAGLMVRQSFDPSAPFAYAAMWPANGALLAYRTTNGASASTGTVVAQNPPRWLKLVRSGDTFTAYQSPDGVNWVSLGSQTVSLGAAVYVGLAVTSHVAGTLATAVFDNISLAAGPGGVGTGGPVVPADVGTGMSHTPSYLTGVSGGGAFPTGGVTVTCPGNGTDVTACLQAAIDSQGSAPLLIPATSSYYLISRSLVVRGSLIGINGRPTIRTNSSAPYSDGDVLLVADGFTGWIYNLHLIGTYDGSSLFPGTEHNHGIEIGCVSGATIWGNLVEGMRGDGIASSGRSGGAAGDACAAQNVIVANNTTRDTYRVGIGCAGNSSNWVIRDNVIDKQVNYVSGVDLEPWQPNASCWNFEILYNRFAMNNRDPLSNPPSGSCAGKAICGWWDTPHGVVNPGGNYWMHHNYGTFGTGYPTPDVFTGYSNVNLFPATNVEGSTPPP